MKELITATSGNKEIMYWGRNDNNQNMNYNDSDRNEGEVNQRKIKVDLPNTPVDSYIHNHFNNGQGTYSVFSGGDLFVLYKLAENNKINNLDDFVMIVTTPHGTLYALTIHNKTQFKKLVPILSVDEQFIEFKYRKSGNLISPSISNDLNEKRLVQLFKDQNMGLTLHRGNMNDLNKWTKLSSDNNDNLKEDNCN